MPTAIPNPARRSRSTAEAQESEVHRYLEIIQTTLPETAWAKEAEAYLSAEPGSPGLSVRACHGRHSRAAR